MSRRYGVIGCRPPRETSPTYENDMVKFLTICEAVVEYVATLPSDSVVVSGGADGVDKVAAHQARSRGLQVVEHLPNYGLHGAKMAPLVRNILIVDDSDEITAFPAPWSTGTWHAIGEARNREKPVCVMKI